MMKCSEINELLPAYQDKSLTPDEKQNVEAHLAICLACQKENDLLSSSWTMLGALEAIEPSPDFRVRFWERIREEEEKKASWLSFPRLIPVMAGVLGVWVVGVGIGATLFLRAHDVPLSMVQPESSLATAYLKHSSERAL